MPASTATVPPDRRGRASWRLLLMVVFATVMGVLLAAVNDVLRGVQEPGGFGYSAGLALRQPSAAETGTTNSNRAVLFIGYTPDMTAAAPTPGRCGATP